MRLLAPVLKDGNWRDAFAEATGKSKEEVKKLAVRLEPKPDVPSTVRKLPTPAGAVPERRGEGAEVRRIPGLESAAPMVDVARTDPTGPGGAARIRGSKRPEVAPLAPERYRVQFTIGEETEKKLRRLQQLLRREIPNGDPAVIFDRAVTLLLEKVEARKLEFHHAGVPFARGGGPEAGNIALHCRAHNAYEGKRVFGDYLPKEIRKARDQYDAMRFPVPERRAGEPEH